MQLEVLGKRTEEGAVKSESNMSLKSDKDLTGHEAMIWSFSLVVCCTQVYQICLECR